MLMMIVGGVAVLAQMALATGNVVMRCFQRPFSGTYELVGFFGAVAWEVFVWGRKIAAYGELSETLKIIYHPFVYGVSLGFALLSLALLVDFITTLFAPGRKPS
jgi:hypothetical protein